MRFMRMLVVPAVVVGAFVFASSALAASPSLYRPFTNGIDQNNAAHAWQQVSGRAAWDSQYGSTIAQQTGSVTYVADQYMPVGYRYGMPGTTNSALSGAGTIVPLQDHAGSGSVKVLVVMNIVTSKTIAFMVRCGNPRLHKNAYVAPLPWKRFARGTVLRIHRNISKPVQIVCPSGQKVSGALNVVFNGIVRGSTWGKVQGSLTEHLRVGLKAQLRAWVTLKCGAPPAVNIPVPPPTPTPSPPVVIIVNQPTCVGANACSSPPPTQTCQAPYTGTYPNCVPPACPAGYTGTYPSCVPPVVNQPPSCSNVASPENGPGGIEADGSAWAGHVSVSGKNGDSITVTFGALYGSFPVGSNTFVSNGIDSIPWSYKAPNDSSAVGRTDVITVNVHDNTTGLNGQSCSSLGFVINAASPQR